MGAAAYYYEEVTPEPDEAELAEQALDILVFEAWRVPRPRIKWISRTETMRAGVRVITDTRPLSAFMHARDPLTIWVKTGLAPGAVVEAVAHEFYHIRQAYHFGAPALEDLAQRPDMEYWADAFGKAFRRRMFWNE